MYEGMWIGLFHAAASGVAFLPIDVVENRFHRTLEENYPEASPSFLKFARSYWTFRMLQEQLVEHHPGRVITVAFQRVERDIGSVFFPMPSPMGRPLISARRREKTQRELIRVSGAPIDVEDFIGGNAILLRDRSKGCLGVLIFLASVAILMALS
jgi:hypothetical protein